MNFWWHYPKPEHIEKLLNGKAGSKINFSCLSIFALSGQLEGVANVEFIGDTIIVEREMYAARLDDLTTVRAIVPAGGSTEMGAFELGVSESIIPVVSMFIEGDIPTPEERLDAIDDKFF